MNLQDKIHELSDGRSITWGVLGGMGPLASSEFLRTIYECSLRSGVVEQEAPVVMLYSDPTFPDRTDCLANGAYDVLVQRLERALRHLLNLEVTGITIACMTIHAVLPLVQAGLRTRVLSLLDLVFNELEERERSYLLLCTEGTRRMEVFQKHSCWPEMCDRIILLDQADQKEVHKIIFDVKSNCLAAEHVEFIQGLLKKYGVAAFIAGCTEMHLLAKRYSELTGRPHQEICIDPLMSMAQSLAATHRSMPAAASIK